MRNNLWIWARDYVFNRQKWLRRGIPRPYTTISIAIEFVLRDKLDLISMNRCPYCRSYWSRKGGLVNHLGKGICAEMLGQDIQLAIKLYKSIKAMIKRGDDPYRVCFNTPETNGLLRKKICLHFRNISTAAKFIKKAIETRQITIPVELPKEIEEILAPRRVQE